MQWKHTYLLASDHWHDIVTNPGYYTTVNPHGNVARKDCPGTTSRTFRTKGVGWALNGVYGGPNGGGLEYSSEAKLPCNLTAH